MHDRHKIKQLVQQLEPEMIDQARSGSRVHLSKLFQSLAEAYIARAEPAKSLHSPLELNRDPLTQLPNRELFAYHVEQAILRAQRHQTAFALVFIDIDHFKGINDNHGHEVGDAVLSTLANRIKSAIRSVDILARLSGDEFCLLVEELDGQKSIEKVIKAIRCALDPNIKINELSLQVTISIGVSVYPLNGTNFKQLLKFADLAMYDAKQKGRNQASVYSEDINSKINLLRQNQQRLNLALQLHTLQTSFDVETELVSDRICGIRQTVFLNDKATLNFDKILDIAKRSNSLAALNQEMFYLAADYAQQWLAKLVEPPRIIIPILKPLLLTQHGIDFIRDEINKRSLSGNLFEFEVSEKDLLTSPDASKYLTRLHMLGCKISLINFGIGPSALTWLSSGNIHKIKVDKTLTANIENNQQARILMQAIIDIAHQFSIRVVAIDIETDQQAQLLYSLKCDGVRGKYSGSQLTAEHVSSLLKTRQNSKTKLSKGNSSSLIEAFMSNRNHTG